jgi:hypothetical protein
VCGAANLHCRPLQAPTRPVTEVGLCVCSLCVCCVDFSMSRGCTITQAAAGLFCDIKSRVCVDRYCHYYTRVSREPSLLAAPGKHMDAVSSPWLCVQHARMACVPRQAANTWCVSRAGVRAVCRVSLVCGSHTLRCCRCLRVPKVSDGCSSRVVKLCVWGRVLPACRGVFSREASRCACVQWQSMGSWAQWQPRRVGSCVLAVLWRVHGQQSPSSRHSSPVSVCRRFQCASSDCVQEPP